MKEIELVIKMSQESYNNLKIGCTQRVSDSEMIEALKNGIPLTKGHDRLVEANEVVKALFNHKTIYDVPTIIEADKAEREK